MVQARSRAAHLDDLLARFKAREEWWAREFPKADKPIISKLFGAPRSGNDSSPKTEQERQVTAPTPMPSPVAPAPAPAPAPAFAAERRVVASDTMNITLAGQLDSGPGTGPSPSPAAAPASTIQLTPWAPDSAYARRLREASREQVYQRYLDERPDFANSTGFYLDAADVLFDKGLPELGLRVLSNLAEMNLENRQILRVLGYRLLQAKQPRLAIPVFEAVLRLAPNEPQSYRDLGLAHAEAGQWQPAADRLWDVASRAWDARFPDIDLIAVAELNAIVAQAEAQGTPVQTRAFDPRLLHNLPLDLRIVLAWDADNTDIDLWVVDPNGEETYFGHPLSRQGGRMTRDATGGYGPEEFALRQAKPGTYTVKAKFYGHRQQVLASATTVMLRLTLGFGTPQQKDERVTMRLDGAGDMVTVGTFEVRR
jgi:tetratricopeptide (TPR) repeat protein